MRRSNRTKKFKFPSQRFTEWLDQDQESIWRRFLKYIWLWTPTVDPNNSFRWWFYQFGYLSIVVSLSGYELARLWPAVGKALWLIGMFDFGYYLPATVRPLVVWTYVAYFAKAFVGNLNLMRHR